MKKNNIVPKLMYSLAAFIQLGLIVAVCVIQYLSDKKAGVMRHLYTRKMQFENTIFSLQNLEIQKIAVIVIGILLFILELYVIKNKKDIFSKVQSILSVILSVALYLAISSSFFIDKLAYHYFIMAFAIVLVTQIIITITILFKKK